MAPYLESARGAGGVGRMRGLSFAITVGAVFGLLVSGYLARSKLSGSPLLCPYGGNDCDTVAASRFAELWGLPVAVWGVGGYFAIAAVATWISWRGTNARGMVAPVWAPLGFVGVDVDRVSFFGLSHLDRGGCAARFLYVVSDFGGDDDGAVWAVHCPGAGVAARGAQR